jgi:triosephosphate isomerase
LYFQEDLGLIAAKFRTAMQLGLQPILCVGETLEQREAATTETVLQEQLESVIQTVSINLFRHALIAYEPVWAIGTGVTATPAQAQAAHVYIRSVLSRHNVEVAGAARILYGGSLKPENAKEILAMPDIDGGLVGGASLNADSFLSICEAVKQCTN